MDYSMFIDSMEWSYSRLTSFEDCKYGWFLNYIKKERRGAPHFFSTYGSFVHDIMEKYLSNRISREELLPYFIENYEKEVHGEPPSEKIGENFYNNTISYLRNINFPFNNIVDTEKKVEFDVGGHSFVGYIDVLAEQDGGLHIVDHKSHGLRYRSGRKNPTLYDIELDNYLRQQYLYAIPIKEEFGEYPKTISFNCYRHGRFITESFDENRLDATKEWASDLIQKISNERVWEAKPDAFRCKYICDFADSCEYCKKFNKYRKK